MMFIKEAVGALLGGIAVFVTIAAAWLACAGLLYVIFEVLT